MYLIGVQRTGKTEHRRLSNQHYEKKIPWPPNATDKVSIRRYHFGMHPISSHWWKASFNIIGSPLPLHMYISVSTHYYFSHSTPATVPYPSSLIANPYNHSISSLSNLSWTYPIEFVSPTFHQNSTYQSYQWPPTLMNSVNFKFLCYYYMTPKLHS